MHWLGEPQKRCSVADDKGSFINVKQYTARTYLLRTRTEEEAGSDSDHVTMALVTLFLSVLI